MSLDNESPARAEHCTLASVSAYVSMDMYWEDACGDEVRRDEFLRSIQHLAPADSIRELEARAFLRSSVDLPSAPASASASASAGTDGTWGDVRKTSRGTDVVCLRGDSTDDVANVVRAAYTRMRTGFVVVFVPTLQHQADLFDVLSIEHGWACVMHTPAVAPDQPGTSVFAHAIAMSAAVVISVLMLEPQARASVDALTAASGVPLCVDAVVFDLRDTFAGMHSVDTLAAAWAAPNRTVAVVTYQTLASEAFERSTADQAGATCSMCGEPWSTAVDRRRAHGTPAARHGNCIPHPQNCKLARDKHVPIAYKLALYAAAPCLTTDQIIDAMMHGRDEFPSLSAWRSIRSAAQALRTKNRTRRSVSLERD